MLGLENKDPREVVDGAGNTAAHILAILGTGYVDREIRKLTNIKGTSVAQNMMAVGHADFLDDDELIEIIKDYDCLETYLTSRECFPNNISYAVANALVGETQYTWGELMARHGYMFSDDQLTSGKLLKAGNIALVMVSNGRRFTNAAVLTLEGDRGPHSMSHRITVQDLQMLSELIRLPPDQVWPRLSEPAVESALLAGMRNDMAFIPPTRAILDHVFTGGKTGEDILIDLYKDGKGSAHMHTALTNGLISVEDKRLDEVRGLPAMQSTIAYGDVKITRIESLLGAIKVGLNSWYRRLKTPANQTLLLEYVEERGLADTDVIDGFDILVGAAKAVVGLPISPDCVTVAVKDNGILAHILARMGHFISDIEILSIENKLGTTVADYYDDYLGRREEDQPVTRDRVREISIALKRLYTLDAYRGPTNARRGRQLSNWWEAIYRVVGPDPKWFPSIQTTVSFAPYKNLGRLLEEQLKEVGDRNERARLFTAPSIYHGMPVGTILHYMSGSIRGVLPELTPGDILRLPCDDGKIMAHYNAGVLSAWDGVSPEEIKEILKVADNNGRTVAHTVGTNFTPLFNLVDEETLRLVDATGDVVAHRLAMLGYITVDKELLLLTNGNGDTVAGLQAARGWVTTDPDIYRVVDRNMTSVLERMAVYQFRNRKRAPGWPMQYASQ